MWPAGTREVARLGDAWVATASADFTPDDLTLVRRQFPARYVTLDGDTITVWPCTPPGRPPAPGPRDRNCP
ncbi:hypothetical protein [Streptomyces sp. NPDC059378]|uniref:hypothetical protein n=1 Tax=Streptomyces sp. NPDC059378 TaxID=3346815 RepID=UPI00367EDCA3